MQSSTSASLCGSLQHGANEDAVDAENRSPLHWAGVCLGNGTGGWLAFVQERQMFFKPLLKQISFNPSKPPLAAPQVSSCCVTMKPSWMCWIM